MEAKKTLSPRGALVVFEGIDGAGKTTQVAALAAWGAAQGLDVLRTKEPTDGPWGRKLRASAQTGRLPREEELHAFLEDRREHVAQELAPALARGALVIVDRYYFSTAAYQGARGGDPAAILAANEAFAPQPDALFLVDTPLDTGLARIGVRGDVANHFERREDLARAAAIFATLARPYLTRLDGTQSVDALAAQVQAVVRALPMVTAALGG